MLSPEDRGKGAAGRGVLPRYLERAQEHDMSGFKITPDDLNQMEQIARVSSRGPSNGAEDFGGQPDRWTELAVYYRAGANRPFVAVVEGHSVRVGEKMRFQYAAMGTLDRAVNWFEGSNLRDELAALIPDAHEIMYPTGGRAPKMWRAGWIDPVKEDEAAEAVHGLLGGPSDRIPHMKPGEPIMMRVLPFYSGPESLTDALAWLYPSDQARSPLAIATDFERDFGVPARTARNTLAIEAGRTEGKVGPWLKPFIAALRYFDRAAWEASRG